MELKEPKIIQQPEGSEKNGEGSPKLKVDSKVENPRKLTEYIRQNLLNPRFISQKLDAEGEKGVESSVAQVTAKTKIFDKSIKDKEAVLKLNEDELRRIETMKAENVLNLEQRLEAIITRFKKMFKVKDKTAAGIEKGIKAMESEIQALDAQSSQLHADLQQLVSEQAELPAPAKLLEAYYAKMETMPLSNEEKREFLKPEAIAELSTEEYIALWRRLNPHFLSHVTRQGFREHSNLLFEGALERSQEFHHGLNKMLENKQIRPPLSLRGLDINDEQKVKQWLSWVLEKATSAEEAKETLNIFFEVSFSGRPKYADGTAVHFAAQEVLDDSYGSEKTNQIFIIYPTDLIASQHDYSFWRGSTTIVKTADFNVVCDDVFVWPSKLNKPGIPVDSGIVFLPKNTPVDPETGSKYASDVKTIDNEEKRVMIEDKKLISAFVGWATSLTEESPGVKAYKEYDKESYYWQKQNMEKVFVDLIRQEMLQLGFCMEVADDLSDEVSRKLGAFCYHGKLCWDDGSPEEAAQAILQTTCAKWKRAEKTITAEAYWEKYFEQNPEQKPNHLVFYNGSPKSAVDDFKKKHNIGQADVSETEGASLGFEDHYIQDMSTDLRSNPGYDELLEMAHKIIEDHYGKKV